MTDLAAAMNKPNNIKIPTPSPVLKKSGIILPQGGVAVSTKVPTPPTLTLTRDEAVKALLDIRQTYMDTVVINQYTALLMGIYSSGKTTALGTARKPIIINSFDPTGTLVLRRLVTGGDVFIRPYWNENRKTPTEYRKWEAQWERDIRSGLLSMIGTYCIDSFTTFVTALVNDWCKSNTGGLPYLNDYLGIYALINDIVKRTASTGVDFILTGHLTIDTDDVSGKRLAMLDTYGKLKTELPLLFTEKLVIHPDGYQDKVKYELLTAPRGKFHAGTQLGAGGLLDPVEEPNFRNILKKVGLPYEDKDLFKDVAEAIKQIGGDKDV